MAHALREKAAVSGIGETAYTLRRHSKERARAATRSEPEGDRGRRAEARGHRRRCSGFSRRRHRRGFHRQSRLARSHAVAVRADGRRDLRRGLIQSAAMAVVLVRVEDSALLTVGSAWGPWLTPAPAWSHPPAAVPAVRVGGRVRSADRHVRAGWALCPGRAVESHAALRHSRCSHGRGRGDDAPERDILNGNVVMNKPLTVEEHHAS